MNRRFFIALAMSATLGTSTASLAQDSTTILTVNDGNTDTQTTFTEAELLALPQSSFQTTTVWTDGLTNFSGPSLSSILEAAGVEDAGNGLRIHALNDYNVEFPAEHIEEDVPIIANRIDGAPFSVRNKGPLWLVFPFDQDARYQSEDIFALSVWQLTQIDVLSD